MLVNLSQINMAIFFSIQAPLLNLVEGDIYLLQPIHLFVFTICSSMKKQNHAHFIIFYSWQIHFKFGTPIPYHAKMFCMFCFLAATKQLYEWFSPSVRPSVCPSVCPSVRLSVRHTFLTMFLSTYHHEIFRSYYQRQKWRPCKRWRSEVKGQGHRGHDPT